LDNTSIYAPTKDPGFEKTKEDKKLELNNLITASTMSMNYKSSNTSIISPRNNEEIFHKPSIPVPTMLGINNIPKSTF
jgi:hypothetical protein